jgi:bacterioferritin-associated ferredoxin
MIVCSCNVISDHAIRAVVDRTLGNPQPAHEIYRSLGYVPDCGRCARSVKQVIKAAMGEVAFNGRAACGGLEQDILIPECADLDADSLAFSDQNGSCGPDCCQNRSRADQNLSGLGLDTSRFLGSVPEAMAQAAE